MAKKRDLLTQMHENPAGDWTIADIEKLCRRENLEIRAPNGGSHYVVSSPFLFGNVTPPYKRPIKQRYIKQLVSYALAHRDALRRHEDEGK